MSLDIPFPISRRKIYISQVNLIKVMIARRVPSFYTSIDTSAPTGGGAVTSFRATRIQLANLLTVASTLAYAQAQQPLTLRNRDKVVSATVDRLGR